MQNLSSLAGGGSNLSECMISQAFLFQWNWLYWTDLGFLFCIKLSQIFHQVTSRFRSWTEFWGFCIKHMHAYKLYWNHQLSHTLFIAGFYMLLAVYMYTYTLVTLAAGSHWSRFCCHFGYHNILLTSSQVCSQSVKFEYVLYYILMSEFLHNSPVAGCDVT